MGRCGSLTTGHLLLMVREEAPVLDIAVEGIWCTSGLTLSQHAPRFQDGVLTGLDFARFLELLPSLRELLSDDAFH